MCINSHNFTANGVIVQVKRMRLSRHSEYMWGKDGPGAHNSCL